MIVCLESATLVSSSKIGTPGHTIDVDTWTADIYGLTYEGTVTRDTCTPVLLSYRGEYNGSKFLLFKKIKNNCLTDADVSN